MRSHSKTRVLAGVVCATGLVGVSTAASAADFDLGLLTPRVAPYLFNGDAPIGPFVDTYFFEVPKNGGTGYSVINFPKTVTIPNVGTFTFDTVFSSIALVSDPDGIPYNGNDVGLASISGVNANSLELSWKPTNAGSMYLVVSGIGQGTAGGLYSGGITVSPVPEAETWAMMLIGAGLVGFRLHKHSKKAAASRLV